MFYTWWKRYLNNRKMERQADINSFNRYMKAFDDLLIIEEYEWEGY